MSYIKYEESLKTLHERDEDYCEMSPEEIDSKVNLTRLDIEQRIAQLNAEIIYSQKRIKNSLTGYYLDYGNAFIHTSDIEQSKKYKQYLENLLTQLF